MNDQIWCKIVNYLETTNRFWSEVQLGIPRGVFQFIMWACDGSFSLVTTAVIKTNNSHGLTVDKWWQFVDNWVGCYTLLMLFWYNFCIVCPCSMKAYMRLGRLARGGWAVTCPSEVTLSDPMWPPDPKPITNHIWTMHCVQKTFFYLPGMPFYT